MTQATIKALREQRLFWVDLGDGLRVQCRRPVETDMHRFLGGVNVEHVCEYVAGWEGVTEATLLGEAVGSSDPVPFDRELWAEWARDNAAVCGKVAQAMADAMSAFLSRREAVAKN